jgi:CheY-like chemotaxis protein
MDFSRQRVLVVGAKTHAVQLLRSVLVIGGITKIVYVEDGETALELLGTEPFQAVFCDCVVTSAGVPFVAAARRSKSVRNPMIAIFLLKERASRRDVEVARDSGATGVVTVPISPKTLYAKLEAAANAPRSFIVAGEFFGPDRRARLRPAFGGADRRKLTPRPFVVAGEFSGPDRRAKLRPVFGGVDRRKLAPRKTKADSKHL